MLAHTLATIAIAAPLLIGAPLIFAKPAIAYVQEKPAEAPPAASATFEARNNWCQKYAAWFVEQMPKGPPMPADVRPTHRIETEVQFCNLDPPEYERLTTAELTGATAAG